MTKEKPNWDDGAPQPFKNEAAVYTYIPRNSGAPRPGVTRPMMQQYPRPAFYPYYPPQAQFTPAYPQPYVQHYPMQTWYSHYSQPVHVPAPLPYQYEPRAGYYYNGRPQMASAYYQPQPYYCAPAQVSVTAAPAYEGRRLTDGTRPWYGRTRSEVQEDEWKEREQYEKDVKKCDEHSNSDKDGKKARPEAKSIEPKGKSTDQYWVQHRDGGIKAYPLGTIKNNFEGTWKVDGNGWPYLVEK